MQKLVKPKLSEQDKMQLKETFDLFDIDGSGRIDPKVISQLGFERGHVDPGP